MAVSHDQFRIVYFQGHPVYYANSLLKEYKREVTNFFSGKRQSYPPHPEHYFGAKATAIADNYQRTAVTYQRQGQPIPPFPEKQIGRHLDNTWRDTSKAIVHNWLGLVYELTDIERGVPFLTGVNPDDPLGLF